MPSGRNPSIVYDQSLEHKQMQVAFTNTSTSNLTAMESQWRVQPLTKILASKPRDHADNKLTTSVENKKLLQSSKSKPRYFFETHRDSVKFKAPDELNSDSAVTLP